MRKLLFIAPILFLLSCAKVDKEVVVSGILQENGITTFQYGTHVLGGYALRSSTIDLNLYVNQQVTIRGQKIDGYPVDGGPDYLEVESIE